MPLGWHKRKYAPEFVRGINFYCGPEPYQKFLASWITDEKAVASSRSKWRKNQLFLYLEDDLLVGFGELGEGNRNFPEPEGERRKIPVIPRLAIRQEFWGKPPGDKQQRYSFRILSDLLNLAQQKFPDSMLTLDVHRDNARGIAFYRAAGFFDQGYIQRDHLRMYIHL